MKICTILLILCSTLISCDSYYFNKPQPIDSKDIYKLPKKLTGTWIIEKNDSGGLDSLIIGKDYFQRIMHFTIEDDINTDSNTYIIGNEIYNRENGNLEGGYPITYKDDSTIVITCIENELVEFGRKAFLRKIKYGYILNIKHDKMDNWWEIRFVDTREKRRTIIRGLNTKDMVLNKNHSVLHEDLNKYILASWTKDDIKQFIDKGGFSDTLLILEFSEKLNR